jgi:CRISPR-associated protein Csx17
LVLRAGPALLDELWPYAMGDFVLRCALALATARDEMNVPPTLSGLRPLLSPVEAAPNGRVAWTDGPALCPLAGGLTIALAEAARRRAFPDAVFDPTGDEIPAVRGVPIAFTRGVLLRASDVSQLVVDPAHDVKIAELLAGLLTVDWWKTADQLRPLLPGSAENDVALNLLLPFAARKGIPLSGEDGEPWSLLLRPGTEWPALLAADRITDVVADAGRRLRIGGLKQVITPHVSNPGPIDGRRLASTLLLRVRRYDMISALNRIAELPQRVSPKEISV